MYLFFGVRVVPLPLMINNYFLFLLLNNLDTCILFLASGTSEEEDAFEPLPSHLPTTYGSSLSDPSHGRDPTDAHADEDHDHEHDHEGTTEKKIILNIIYNIKQRSD